MTSPLRRFLICEVPNPQWTLEPTLARPIDTTGCTARQWLQSLNVEYRVGVVPGADLYLEPESYERVSPKSLAKRPYLMVRKYLRPTVSVIGEPYEYSTLAYWTCPPKTTLAVAPGDRFERFFYPTEDPFVTFEENWNARPNRIVWIARPYPWRVDFARRALEAGLPLDVYSRHDWGLTCWKGPAEFSGLTMSGYRYAIAGENFDTHGCHTEKLSHALLYGCVPFYDCDPALDIPEVRGTWLRMSLDNMLERDKLAPAVRQAQKDFWTSGRRSVYSAKTVWAKILLKGLQGREDRYRDLFESLRRI